MATQIHHCLWSIYYLKCFLLTFLNTFILLEHIKNNFLFLIWYLKKFSLVHWNCPSCLLFCFASQEICIICSTSYPSPPPHPPKIQINFKERKKKATINVKSQMLSFFNKIMEPVIFCLRNPIFNLPLLINISILGSRQLEAI